jgi:hypothetical protein
MDNKIDLDNLKEGQKLLVKSTFGNKLELVTDVVLDGSKVYEIIVTEIKITKVSYEKCQTTQDQ